MKISSLYNKVTKAIREYKLINENDKIAVGISGGKDSMVLLYALYGLSRRTNMNFTIYPIHIDMGFENFDLTPIEDFCKTLDLELKIIKTNIGKIIFEERKEKNPCSLCSKMRRGILNRELKKLGCNKLALGHHRDDIITTTMLSLFYEAKIKSLSPISLMDRENVKLIRPLMYVSEKDIISLLDTLDIPVLKSPCPNDNISKRKEIERKLDELEKEIPNLKANVFKAIKNKDFL